MAVRTYFIKHKCRRGDRQEAQAKRGGELEVTSIVYKYTMSGYR
jgi:hypothetical protein